MKTTAPLNVAVVGCGMIARAQHIPNIVGSRHMRLHTCCDVSSGALQKLREQYSGIKITEDYRTAVGDPEVDLIVLATAEHFRVPVYEAAVEARKPVFAEKPLAGTLAEARAVRDKVIGARLPFCIGHNRRFSPAMAEAREIFRRHMNNPSPCPW